MFKLYTKFQQGELFAIEDRIANSEILKGRGFDYAGLLTLDTFSMPFLPVALLGNFLIPPLDTVRCKKSSFRNSKILLSPEGGVLERNLMKAVLDCEMLVGQLHFVRYGGEILLYFCDPYEDNKVVLTREGLLFGSGESRLLDYKPLRDLFKEEWRNFVCGHAGFLRLERGMFVEDSSFLVSPVYARGLRILPLEENYLN
jgi:hypothetical protein